MIKEAIKQLVDGKNLDYDTASAVMNEMMSGEATSAQMASFLTALRIKGETVEEITACAKVMRSKSVHIAPDRDVLDIVGTGGDGTGTFNVSTTAAFIIAAAGVPVAKHGNRSMSSKSGAADCLENLGVDITISPEKSKEILDRADICFMFAQSYHSSMKYVGPTRREIGIRNVFNLLGPLTNPAGATMQVTGVYSSEIVESVARVFSNLGVKRGIVLYGGDGMDEATVSAPTKICEIDNGSFKNYEITPEEMGLNSYPMEEVLGGDGRENAEITRKLLKGELRGAKRDIALLNAGLGIYVGGKAESVEEGVRVAEQMIDSGRAYAKMEEFAALSRA